MAMPDLEHALMEDLGGALCGFAASYVPREDKSRPDLTGLQVRLQPCVFWFMDKSNSAAGSTDTHATQPVPKYGTTCPLFECVPRICTGEQSKTLARCRVSCRWGSNPTNPPP